MKAKTIGFKISNETDFSKLEKAATQRKVSVHDHARQLMLRGLDTDEVTTEALNTVTEIRKLREDLAKTVQTLLVTLRIFPAEEAERFVNQNLRR